jgi:hypothetical protein
MASRPAPDTTGNVPQQRHEEGTPSDAMPGLPSTSGNGHNTEPVTVRQPRGRNGARHEMQPIEQRLAILGVTLINTLIDLMFLGLWIGLQQLARRIFHVIGSLPGMNAVVPTILEIIFDISTLAIVAAFVTHDVWLSVKRVWGKK